MKPRHTLAWAYVVAALALTLYILLRFAIGISHAIVHRDWITLGSYIGGLAVMFAIELLLFFHFKYAPSPFRHFTLLDLNSTDKNR